MEIKRIGSQPSVNGPSEWFTGTVRIDPLFQAPDPALVQGASVTFEPGARTAWHTHPLGQTLVVTAGCGWAQRWNGPIEGIHPGDVVWFAAGEKHWHGATPTTGHDTHRHSAKEGRQGGRLDGARQRRAIPQVNLAIGSLRDRRSEQVPHVIVKLWPGKSEQQKTRLAEAITKDIMDILRYGEESVSVAMEEVESQDWVKKVYVPDVKDEWDKLYKKPGYDENDL